MEASSSKWFEWDLGNIAKIQSRLDLAAVEFAFRGAPCVALGEKHSKHEKRWFLVNKISERFIFVVFTRRNERIRIVSARYMRKREAKKYEGWFHER